MGVVTRQHGIPIGGGVAQQLLVLGVQRLEARPLIGERRQRRLQCVLGVANVDAQGLGLAFVWVIVGAREWFECSEREGICVAR